MKKIIQSNDAPEPIGPYSQAVLINDMLFTSGQIALDPRSGKLILDSIVEETKQVMENLKAVLKSAEMTFDNVVKSTIYIIDIDRPDRPLQRITNSPLVNETHPAAYDAEHFTYLSDKNGIYNRYIAYYDSTISYIDTTVHYRYFSVDDKLSNFPFSAEDYVINPNTGDYSFMIRQNGKFNFYVGNASKDFANEEVVVYTRFMQNKLKLNNQSFVIDPEIEEIEINDDSNAVNINNYQFGKNQSQSVTVEFVEIEDESSIVKIDKTVDDTLAIPFELPRQEIYKINYANDYVVSQFDN